MAKHTSIIIILFFALLLAVSCRDESHERRLIAEAERLAPADPDSALRLLDAILLPDLLEEGLAVRWGMLYARTADSLKRPMPYVSQMRIAVAYYRKRKQRPQWAEALFYLGRAYEEEKEYEQAIKNFDAACTVALQIPDYNRAGYICSHMASLYDTDENYPIAIKKFDESNRYFELAQNWRSYAFGLANQATVYLMDEQDSLALHGYLKADSVARILQDTEVQAYIYNGLGIFYDETGDYQQAEKYALEALRLDSTELAAQYVSLASIYISMGKMDRARLYLKKAQIPTKNEFTPAAVDYYYYQLEKAERNFEKALSYYEKYRVVADSVETVSQSMNLLEIEKRFNHAQLVDENKTLHMKQLYLYMLLLGALVLILLLICVYQLLVNRKNRSISKQKEIIERQNTKIDATITTLQKKEKVLQELAIHAEAAKEVPRLLAQLKESEKQSQLLKEEIEKLRRLLITLREEQLTNSTWENG